MYIPAVWRWQSKHYMHTLALLVSNDSLLSMITEITVPVSKSSPDSLI